MIAYGMKTTLVCFQDKYYNHKGIVEEGSKTNIEDNNCLVIGAFESAFCTDVGATYIYRMNKNITNKLLYAGNYQDDGLTIFKGQRTVDEVAEGEFFQFTVEVWQLLAASNLSTMEEEEEDLGELLLEEWE
eukprot:10540039-Ditylum_brightwellii.AAC.1